MAQSSLDRQGGLSSAELVQKSIRESQALLARLNARKSSTKTEVNIYVGGGESRVRTEKKKKRVVLPQSQLVPLREQLEVLKRESVLLGFCEQLNSSSHSVALLLNVENRWSFKDQLSPQGRDALFHEQGKHFFEQMQYLNESDVQILKKVFTHVKDEAVMCRLDLMNEDLPADSAFLDLLGYQLRTRNELEVMVEDYRLKLSEWEINLSHPPVIGTPPSYFRIELVLAQEAEWTLEDLMSIPDMNLHVLLQRAYEALEMTPRLEMLDALCWNLRAFWNAIRDGDFTPAIHHHVKLLPGRSFQFIQRRHHFETDRWEDEVVEDVGRP